MNIAAQVADVNRPLGSVNHMIKAGNTVIFDSRGSCVINKRSGTVIPIKEKGGNFTMDLWVKSAGNGDVDQGTQRSEGRTRTTVRKEIRPTQVRNSFGELPVSDTEEDGMEVDEF